MMDKILFVDDDNICSYLNVALVKGMGIAKTVVSLQSAEEALAYIQQHYPLQKVRYNACPDFIFLDVHMPGMDGFELLELLEKRRMIDKNRFLFIMLSSTLDPADLEKALQHKDKIFACLPKPLAEEDLQKVLADGMLMH